MSPAGATDGPTRTAVVTGGASGIGRSICQRLAGMGMRVAALDVDASGAADTVRLIAGSGGSAIAVTGDVTNETVIAAAIEQVRRELGAIHVLVNVAGIGEFLPFAEMTRAAWDRMLAVHLTGTFTCTRAVVGDMTTAGWGRIVNTASVAGLNGGGPGLAHYAAAKGGIIAFTKALAHELGPSGVTVNCLAPGLIDTPMVAQSLVSPELRARVVEGAPVRRIGQPEDIAAACAFLVGEDAGFMTGQVLSPNGGRYM